MISSPKTWNLTPGDLTRLEIMWYNLDIIHKQNNSTSRCQVIRKSRKSVSLLEITTNKLRRAWIWFTTFTTTPSWYHSTSSYCRRTFVNSAPWQAVRCGSRAYFNKSKHTKRAVRQTKSCHSLQKYGRRLSFSNKQERAVKRLEGIDSLYPFANAMPATLLTGKMVL